MAEDAVDYGVMTKDQLFEELGKAYEAKDYKLMGKLSTQVAKAEATEAKVAKDKLAEELVAITEEVKTAISKVVTKLFEDPKLAGAEGVWFTYDAGAKIEKGINPACRLMKASRKAAAGDGETKSSYVANPTKSSELIELIGDEVMFEEDTTRRIDKSEITVPAGTTFKEAYELSTNGGWRNGWRMAALKKAGII